MFYLECEFSFENKEKLACVDMGMACLTCAGRHELLDDAELGCLYEMPAVTVCSLWAAPLIVFRGFRAGDL
jgi:hypothetical protein